MKLYRISYRGRVLTTLYAESKEAAREKVVEIIRLFADVEHVEVNEV